MVKNTFGYLVLFCLAILGSPLITPSAAANEPVAVIIYDGVSYTGRSIKVRQSMPSLGYMNDRMSSFKVTPGYVVRFYEGENFKGKYYTKKSDAHESARVPYEDRVRSVKILSGDTLEGDDRLDVAVTIYDGRDHTGRSLDIIYDTPYLGNMRDKLTSFQVSPGYQVRFYTEDNYQGEYYTRDDSNKDGAFTKSWNDIIRSVKILKSPRDHSYGNNRHDY